MHPEIKRGEKVVYQHEPSAMPSLSIRFDYHGIMLARRLLDDGRGRIAADVRTAGSGSTRDDAQLRIVPIRLLQDAFDRRAANQTNAQPPIPSTTFMHGP